MRSSSSPAKQFGLEATQRGGRGEREGGREGGRDRREGWMEGRGGGRDGRYGGGMDGWRLDILGELGDENCHLVVAWYVTFISHRS